MKKPKFERREFIKLGAGALSMLGGCSRGGTDRETTAATANPAAAAIDDAREVVWEMRQSERTPISIDVHAHWSPPSFANAQKEFGAAAGSSRSLADQLTGNLKWMDERAIQAVIWTVSGGGKPWHWLSPAESARQARLVNDAGLEAHQAFPDRIFLGAEIPAMDPELSLKELNRVAGHPAVKGLALPTSMLNKDYLFEPSFGPVLARCEQLGYPLLFHPLDDEVHEYGGTQTRIGQPLTEDSFIFNTLGFPWDTATVATLFIVTGTLDKYPKLQVVLPHAGGVFPYLAGRIEHGIARQQFPLKRAFRDYLPQFYYDTMTYYPETLQFLIDFAGADRVMIGTDGTYDRSALDHSGTGRQGRYEWPNALVEYLKLPKDQEEMILRGNAARLFRM